MRSVIFSGTKNPELSPIESGKPIAGANPGKSLPVLHNHVNRVLGKAFVYSVITDMGNIALTQAPKGNQEKYKGNAPFHNQ